MAFWVLGPDGKPLPGQLPAPWLLADAPGGVSNSVNFFGVTYSPAAQSFIVAYSAGPGIAYVASLQVTSSHLAPAEAPAITVARAGNNVTLQWPASATGYILESTTAPGGTWTAAGLSVSVVDGLSTATTTAADNVRLYRLRKR
jgi:hypothetical protein